MVIILGFGIIGLIIYKRRSTVIPRIRHNNEILGFDNPVYNHEHQNRNQGDNNYANYPRPPGNQDVLYQDTEGYQPDADYLEIQE